MSKKQRPTELIGKTYKIAYKDNEKVYVTINEFADEPKRPFEIFINIPKTDDDAMLKALSLMLSALLRRCDNIAFIIESLKKIKSPRGTWFYDRDIDRSFYVNSLPHAIAYAMEKFLSEGEVVSEKDETDEEEEAPSTQTKSIDDVERKYTVCPKCSEHTLINSGGCKICINQDCAYGGCE